MGVSFRHLGAGLARISFRDLVFDIGKLGFWAPRMYEIVYSGIIGLFFFERSKKKGLTWEPVGPLVVIVAEQTASGKQGA